MSKKLNSSTDKVDQNSEDFFTEDKARLWKGVEEKIARYNRKSKFQLYLKVASTIILAISISLWFINDNHQNNLKIADSKKQVILPGTDKATLITGDGLVLDLSNTSKENLAKLDIDVINTSDGKLIYAIRPTKLGKNNFQTISTPRGGQTKILLPDGSDVTLNASSSITFATNINSLSERRVSLKGEGYFKVSKSTNRPFIVDTERQTIQVMGTEFNVNTYHSSNVYTTLLEGSVKINNNKILKPGQQAIGNALHTVPQVQEVDVADYLDWVNNKFIFKNESITSVMYRLSRWYDFEVKFDLPTDVNIDFSGEISRYADVNEILNLMSKTSDLTFETVGKVITVKNPISP